MEKLPQAHVETWQVRVQLPSPYILSACGHEAAAEGVGAEGRQGEVDREAARPRQGGGHQGHQQVEPDPYHQTPYSTKVP